VCDKCVNLEFICSKYSERIMWRVSIRCVWFISETNMPVLLQAELRFALDTCLWEDMCSELLSCNINSALN